MAMPTIPVMRLWDMNTLRTYATIAGHTAKKADAVAVADEIRRRRIALLAELYQLDQIKKDLHRQYKRTRQANKKGNTR